MKLILATRNHHKLREIRKMLDLAELELVSLDHYADVPEVVEDGATFAANAVKKAVTVALYLQVWAMADDSGLEVDALAGAPGVQSARYAGTHGDDAANNRKLLQDLTGAVSRTARFRCVVALASPQGRAQIVDGVCEGIILEDCRGTGGFGYDPLFSPQGQTLAFAEMSGELKNSISHRAKAMSQARREWGEILSDLSPDWSRRIVRTEG
ncbi:MAG: XTP/dITP diphosphatase [Lentisphaerae bacterium]|nr:XTP/dITP diphosphatase [Lentisphaerota bacterium]